VVIGAVSLRLALIPVAFPTFFHRASPNLQIIVGSGITLGAFTAILLNIFMHILVGKHERAPDERLAPEVRPRLTVEEINQLGHDAFVAKLGPIFRGPSWVVDRAYAHRPFADMTALD
jgi:uric acid transporter